MTEAAQRARTILVGGEILSLILLALTVALAAVEFDGEFGVTGLPVECGSVLGLPSQGDLNAKTCTPDLRAQVNIVGISLLGALLLGALSPLFATRLRTGGEHPKRWQMALAVAGCLVIASAVVVLGRHRIWSVSGG